MSAESETCHSRAGGTRQRGEVNPVRSVCDAKFSLGWIPAFAGMTNREVIVHIQQLLAHENAALEARLLLQHACNMTAEEFLRNSNEKIDDACAATLAQLLQRRLQHEPMSHILGYKDFWKDRFRVTADVLTPRADSETVIEALLHHAPDKTAPLKILELGVGSGCLLLSALREYPRAHGTGVDISEKALEVAESNAKSLNLMARSAFFEGSWCKPLDKTETFDIIISNPPYIAHAAIARLMPDVQGFEPHIALDGGDDGLGCYREIFAEIRSHTHTGTTILVEIGESQAQDITTIARASGFSLREARHDLGGIVRVLVFDTSINLF